MSSLITGLDKYAGKQLGEKASVEYSWSKDTDEKIVQFFFQLVRSKDHSDLEKVHRDILLSVVKRLPESLEQFTIMYKLIAQTRDIISGKGEQRLAFMQIYGFHEAGFKGLAIRAFAHFVQRDNNEHPFGSWKDIKYFCNYVRDRCGSEDHFLIEMACVLGISQLFYDCSLFEECGSLTKATKPRRNITLVARWLPREKSKKFGWIHRKMATMAFSQYLRSAVTPSSKRKAVLKCKIRFTKMLTTLSKFLNTVQIKQCGNQWDAIDFNTVTSATLRKQTLAFANKTKGGGQRSEKADRVTCASNYKSHIEGAKSDPSVFRMHGRRVNLYELVSDALKYNVSAHPEKIDTINLQWEDNRKNNQGLGNMIACVDTSGSMSFTDRALPLHNAIGLGIRVSELAHSAFRDRILTFDKEPEWHNLSDCSNFVEKANKVNSMAAGLNTDFYKMLKRILDVYVLQDLPPKEVRNLTLAIFSDMQIDLAASEKERADGKEGCACLDTMYEHITNLYAKAGMESSYKMPYTPPHILFWNLRRTAGFPTVSTQKNVSMVSGYSSALLNTMCEKGIEVLGELTPRKMLQDVLGNKRYDVLDNDIFEHLSELEQNKRK